MSELTLSEVARRLDVSPPTLRRWVRDGVVPLPSGHWTPAALAHARIVTRLRARGHSLEDIREASHSARLAYGYMQNLLPHGPPAYIAAVLAAGFPLVALLQLVRVYGQAMARIADAEVKLFHLYVHEPLMHDGVPGMEMAEEMEGLARELLPLASPIMDHVHQRFLTLFVEQDVVGHMEIDIDSHDGVDLGRLRVTIAFDDLAGYTRLTEDAGEEQAVDVVERFVEAVETTLPDDARVVKTIGDEVKVVASDPASLVDWAVGFQALHPERPLPRIGIHQGLTLYRDGDYFGRAVNLAARVGARAGGGEVLVTRPVVEGAVRHLDFERSGEVKLKGFKDSTELFLARPAEG